MTRSRARYRRETAEFGRSLSFFDAVYAFSVTLLIANLDVPPPSAWTNVQTLLSTGLGSQVMAYAISFVVIVVFWRNNQALISRMQHLDSATIWLNIISVGVVIFIPFSTQAMGDPLTEKLELPTALYACNVGIIIVMQVAMFQVAIRHGLVADAGTPRDRRLQFAGGVIKAAVFFASVPLTFAFGANAGKIAWASLLVISPLIGRYITHLEQRPAREPVPD